MHAAAGAVSTGLTTPDEEEIIFEELLRNPVHICSFSPFNTYFILDAVARLRLVGGRAAAMQAALDVVRRCWHGMNRLNATTYQPHSAATHPNCSYHLEAFTETFYQLPLAHPSSLFRKTLRYWETFSAEWTSTSTGAGLYRPGEATPNGQTGYMSRCHPWSSGAAPWLTQNVLGISPLTPGFKNFVVRPYLDQRAPNFLSSVRGAQPITENRFIDAGFSCNGHGWLHVPDGTEADLVSMPTCGQHPDSLLLNGRNTTLLIDSSGDVYVRNLTTGNYTFEIIYSSSSTMPLSGAATSEAAAADHLSSHEANYRDKGLVSIDCDGGGALNSTGYGSVQKRLLPTAPSRYLLWLIPEFEPNLLFSTTIAVPATYSLQQADLEQTKRIFPTGYRL